MKKAKELSASKKLFERSKKIIPGGVNSPVRAFKAVGGTPVFISHGDRSRIYSSEGREFIDFCGSWGPLVLGHAHSTVVKAVQEAAANGMSFGAATELEVEMAELLHKQAKYLEMIRLMNSGTEAAMIAIRLARAYTRRNKILKFDGCYHGHVDCLLVSAGSGVLAGNIMTSGGITPNTAAEVFVAPYNNLEIVSQILDAHGGEIAALIVEPVAGNMGLVIPEPGFLKGLRKLTTERNIVLIFDEVITGFRLGATTYGSLCDIIPDLTCLGKIIGGGMPIGAVGGRADIMKLLAPLGKVYQAGTLSGNPLAVSAGIATLKTLIEENPYPAIAKKGGIIADRINYFADASNKAFHCMNLGGMFTIFFTAGRVRNLNDAKKCDTAGFARFFHGLLKEGIYLPPSQFEISFISAAHSDDDINCFLTVAREVLLRC